MLKYLLEYDFELCTVQLYEVYQDQQERKRDWVRSGLGVS